MKKTKIILPAIALLAVSGIASVTGTVAWFTASSAVSGTVSNIAAVATTGNLLVENVTTTGASWGLTTAPTVNADNTQFSAGLPLLRDASYDNANGVVYQALYNSDGNVDSFEAVDKDATSTTADGDKAYYTAAFTLKFTVVNIQENENYYLFFDNTSNSHMNDGKDIDKAFRVSMEGSKKVVWAPNNDATTVSYVSGTTTASTSTYTTENKTLINSTAASSKFTTANADATAATCLSGALTKGSNTVTVKFVFWFEGTDANCVTSKLSDDAASLAMSFYSVKKA